MKTSTILVSVALLLGILTACAGNLSTPIPTSNANFLATIVAATLSASPSSTSIPTSTKIPTLAPPPTETPSFTPPVSWELYVDPIYGFSFLHPPLDQTCCGMSGPFTGDIKLIISLSDASTVMPGTDAPFDGLTVYVVTNSEGLSLEQYIDQEKTAQLKASDIMAGGTFTSSKSDSTFTLDGQSGIVIRGYCWDGIPRIYIPFPESDKFLVISLGEKTEGSFEQTFRQILSTFHFAD